MTRSSRIDSAIKTIACCWSAAIFSVWSIKINEISEFGWWYNDACWLLVKSILCSLHVPSKSMNWLILIHCTMELVGVRWKATIFIVLSIALNEPIDSEWQYNENDWVVMKSNHDRCTDNQKQWTDVLRLAMQYKLLCFDEAQSF